MRDYGTGVRAEVGELRAEVERLREELARARDRLAFIEPRRRDADSVRRADRVLNVR